MHENLLVGLDVADLHDDKHWDAIDVGLDQGGVRGGAFARTGAVDEADLGRDARAVVDHLGLARVHALQ